MTQHKGIHKLGLGTLSVFLSILMIVYLIPLSVYADLAPTIEGNEDTTAPVEQTEQITDESTPPDAMFELTDRREQNVKHFRLSDGSIVAAQYAAPVHEQDENGEWHDIDNTLGDSGNEYATPNARVKFAKKITGNQNLFALHDGKYKITMSLDGAIKKTPGTVTNTKTEFGEDATQLQKMMTLDKLSAKIMYADILDGVNLEYVLESVNIKENIIVKEKKDSYTYTFTLNLNNLTAALQQDGSIHITDPDSGEVKYRMPAPIVYDAAGITADSSLSAYTLTQTGNHTYTLAVTVNADWMNAEEREFPVTVDPTLINTSLNVIDTYIRESDTSGGNHNDVDLIVDEYTISYWKLNSLPTLPENATVIDATISLQQKRYRTDERVGKTVVGAYYVISNWNQYLTWNQAKEEDPPYGELSTKMLDYNVIEYEEQEDDGEEDEHSSPEDDWYVSEALKLYTWNITYIVKKWYSGSATNYGVAFDYIISPQSTREAYFCSSETFYAPQFLVTYNEIRGLEPYWSTVDQSIGFAGTGHVNVATGELTLTTELTSTTDGLFSYSPTLVYNSSMANKKYTSEHENVPLSNSFMPYGFKFDFQETLIRKSIVDNTNLYYYIWIDADGTEHWFYPIDNTNQEYRDGDGLQLTLTTDTPEPRITDANHNTRYFAPIYDNSEQTLIGYYLSEIKDMHGNAIYFTYNDDLLPTTIGIDPYGDATPIEYFEIHYNSNGAPSLLLNTATYEGIAFRYSDTPTGEISHSASQYLRQIAYAQGKSNTDISHWTSYCNASNSQTNLTEITVAEYNYNFSGILHEICDTSSGYLVKYGYSTNGTLRRIDEYGNNALGQSIWLRYEDDYTRIRTSGADDIPSNSDDVFTYYAFDKYGRIVSSYSTDASNDIIYGATVGTYESENENAKNSLKSQAVIGGDATNYIMNGGFESSYAWIKSNSNVYYTSNDLIPDRRMTFDLPALGNASIYQYVEIPNGEYSLSMNCSAKSVKGGYIRLQAQSVTNPSHLFTKQIDLSTVGTDGSFDISPVLAFQANNSSGDTEHFKISIFVYAGSDANGITYIDNVTLEKNPGAGAYSLLEFGSFEDTAVNSTGNTTLFVNSFWKTQNRGVPSYNEDTDLFGQSAYINGDVMKEQYIFQIHTLVSESDYNLHISSNAFPQITLPRTFVVSGFAKGTEQLCSPDAEFGLKIKVTYHNDSGENEEYDNPNAIINVKLRDYDNEQLFEFSRSCNDWQYISGTFTTQPGKIVKSIEVRCVYSNHPGEAYFDNISLVEVKDNSSVEYEYYDNGLLKYSLSPLNKEYYVYDNRNRLIKKVTSDFYVYDYTYTGYALATETVSKYEFRIPLNYAQQEWYDVTYYGDHNDDDQPELAIVQTPLLKTHYDYNAYGLLKQTILYSATASTPYTLPEDIKKDYIIPVTYQPQLESHSSYIINEGSKIFGQISSETDTNGNTIQYVYDGINLLYQSNQNEGLYYMYNNFGEVSYVYPLYYDPNFNLYYGSSTASVSYTYDDQHRVSKIKTQTTEYTFTYDQEFGNQESILIDGVVWATYEYADRNGKPIGIHYSNGDSATYSYDSLDRISQICYTNVDSDGNTTQDIYTYTYLADGSLHAAQSSVSGRKYEFNYNDSGNLSSYAEYDVTSGRLLDVTYQYTEDDKLDLTTMQIGYLVGESKVSAEFYYSYEYNDDDELEVFEADFLGGDGTVTRSFTYDDLSHLTAQTTLWGSSFNQSTSYQYKTRSYLGTTYTTEQLASYTSTINGVSTEYELDYDQHGNITELATDPNTVIKYRYDDIGQLIREENPYLGETYVYTYDRAGNRTKKQTYKHDTSTLKSTITYSYDGDRLNNYNGTTTFEYDSLGNPLQYYNGSAYTFAWQNGRQLSVATKGNKTLTFKYNDEGIRTSKTVNGVEHIYTLNGSQIVSETWGNNTLIYLYDESGSPIGMQYRQSGMTEGLFYTFFFEKNLFGDIVAIYNEYGVKVISYTYDAWGNVKQNLVNMLAQNLYAQYNPFRYRGYYYDTETGFYYLESRYYDPATGRFINADVHINANGDLIGYNMYAYCSNNPVMYTDSTGEFALSSFLIGLGIAAAIGAIISATSYTTSQCIDAALTGDFEWSWGEFAGCTVGGAIGGAISYVFPGIGTIGGAIISGFTTTMCGMIGQNMIDGTNHSAGNIIISSFLSAGASGLCAGVMRSIKIPGLNAGRGNYSAIEQQINTKFRNGLIQRISSKTFGKMLATNAYHGIASTITNGGSNFAIDFYNKVKIGLSDIQRYGFGRSIKAYGR